MNSHEQQFHQNTQMGSGLTRYRSAPSSYFASLLTTPSNDGGFGAADFEQLFNPRASSPETQMIFSRFMNSSTAVQPPITPPPTKLEAEEYQPQLQLPSNDFSSAPQMMYSAAADTSFTKVLPPPPPKMEHSSGLIRHSSSPAGLFANINIENELKTIGSYGGGNSANAEATFSSANRVMNYSSSTSSRPTPSGMISTISENSAVDTQFDDDHGNDIDYFTGLPWDDSSLLSDSYLKGLADNNNQRYEAGNRPTTQLSHHLSLPKSSAAMEKLLQDSVPCRTRAKRGCATHPRSIAERVRRTKISERMRKLQELVPNMEKQTNTSDMLDLAVDYIKDLQKQLKTLSGNHAKCACSAKQRS